MIQWLSTELRYLTLVEKLRMVKLGVGGYGTDLHSWLELRQMLVESADNPLLTSPWFTSPCSGLMIPDTKLGGKVSTINEVFNDKTTTTYIFY